MENIVKTCGSCIQFQSSKYVFDENDEKINRCAAWHERRSKDDNICFAYKENKRSIVWEL